MKYQLDPHTFLWFLAGDRQLGDRARELVENLSNERFFTGATPNAYRAAKKSRLQDGYGDPRL